MNKNVGLAGFIYKNFSYIIKIVHATIRTMTSTQYEELYKE